MMKIALLLLSLFPFSAKALTVAEFQEKMRKHVAGISSKANVGVRIEVLGSGQEIFSHNDEKKLIPASNAKLLTSMAALEKLGPGFTFETKVYRKGKSLVLAGNGDPFLVSERLWLLARDVARSGVKSVQSIQVNNIAFSEIYRGLTEFQNTGEPFTALVSATSLNFNSLEVHVVPQASGAPKVELGPLPHSYAILKNEVKAAASGSGRGITVKSLGIKDHRETFAVSGSIGRKADPIIVYGAVEDPDAYIAFVFAALLRKEGVAVAEDFGGSIREPLGDDTVAKLPSVPLQDLVRSLNTYSNNFMAEELFQSLSRTPDSENSVPASMEKSQQAMKEFLAKHSACANSTVANGSGLAWDTRVSAACFVQTVQDAYRDFRIFADLLGSLPVGGSTGTLKQRFKLAGSDFIAEKVRAKTGTLWSKQAVTSLTGITAAASGEKILFTLIENDQRNDPGLLRGQRDWEDRCIEWLEQLKI